MAMYNLKHHFNLSSRFQQDRLPYYPETPFDPEDGDWGRDRRNTSNGGRKH